MGRDDSWPATVPSVVLSLWYSLSEKATQKHPKWQNHTSYCESDGRFWIGKPGYQFEFPSNHMSMLLNFGDICVWWTDRWMDNADHYYGWSPHCGGLVHKGWLWLGAETYILICMDCKLTDFLYILFLAVVKQKVSSYILVWQVDVSLCGRYYSRFSCSTSKNSWFKDQLQSKTLSTFL